MAKQDTKNALMNAAEEAVRKHGHDGFSYADLSKKIGIRKASIHYHFPSKADLLTSIMQRYRNNLLKELEKIDNRGEKAAKRLLAYIDLYRAALKEGTSLCLCVAFSAGQETLNDETRFEIASFRKNINNWLIKTFVLAIQDGSLKEIDKPEEEAAHLFSLMEGAQIGARFDGSLKHFDLTLENFQKRLNTS